MKTFFAGLMIVIVVWVVLCGWYNIIEEMKDDEIRKGKS
jgi:hypothetical protein